MTLPPASTRRSFLTGVAGLGTGSGVVGLGTGSAVGLASGRSDRSATTPPQPVERILGANHVAGRYDFTDEDYLNEGANVLRTLGSRVVKIWFHLMAEKYPFDADWTEFDDMVEVAEHEYVRQLFEKPFDTYVLSAYALDNPNDDRHYFRTGMSAADARREEEAFYDLTKHLLRTYRGTDKTFVLQHWEGDWVVVPDDGPGIPEPTTTAVDGMVRWLNARQAGIRRARAEIDSDVRVFGAAEVVLVKRAMEGERRVVNAVVPRTNVDFVSYSAWAGEQLVASNPDRSEAAFAFRRLLDFVDEQAPDPDEYVRGVLGEGQTNVYLGEFGWPTVEAGTEETMRIVRTVAEESIDWGVRWALYWQVFDNEIRTESESATGRRDGRPSNEDVRGFYLVRPDGTKSPVWDYFAGLFETDEVSHEAGDFARLTLSYDETVSEHEVNPDVSPEHSRELAFVCHEIELVGPDGSRTYDVGTPSKESVLFEGTFGVESSGGRTYRWFGGSTGRTVLFVDEDALRRANLLRLRGTGVTDAIEAEVSVRGRPVGRVDFDGDGVRNYEVSLGSAAGTATTPPTTPPTATTDSAPANGRATSTRFGRDEPTPVDRPGFGVPAGLTGLALGAYLCWRNDERGDGGD